jgi:hypothetical protein
VEEHDDGGDGTATLLPLRFALARRAEAKRRGIGMRAERVRTGSRGRARPWGSPQPRVGRRRTPAATGRAAPDRGRHGVHAREAEGDGVGEVGPACRAGPETGRRPGKSENAFLFSFQIQIFANSHKFEILKLKMTFSRLDPKIEVVQKLILYNLAFGHILKFQTDFELRIQSLFFN